MVWDLQSVELLVRVLGELALISMIYGSICRLRLAGVQRQIAHGLLFGGAAIVTMLFPMSFGSGVSVDGHLMMLAHGAAFGGPVTFLISAMVSLAYKVAVGHGMMSQSLVAVATVGLLGLVWHWLVQPRGQLALWSLIVLGVVNSLHLVLFFLLPLDVALPMFLRTLPVGLLITVLGSLLMGKFIEREMRHIAREARLTSDALTDVLTGLGNRRAFEQAMLQIDGAGKLAALLVADIDHFKSVNDTYGHETGDAVLRAVGSALSETLGKAGQAFRTGGEEFTILLHGAGKAEAVGAAERLRLAVAQLAPPAVPRSVTISLGVAPIAPSTGAMSAMRKADKALYLAKAAGRNRSVVTDDDALPYELQLALDAAA